MRDMSCHTEDPLQYENRLRFPAELERAYRRDYAARSIKLQRQFLLFGFVLYGLFGILDYYALPRSHMTAWLLRGLVEPLPLLLYFWSFRPAWQARMGWLLNAWTLVMSLSILGMIMAAQQSELAYFYYPVGLMLVLICGYIGSGNMWYGSVQGWLTVAGYLLVGLFDQRLAAVPSTALKFFTLNFFLIGMNIIGVVLSYTLERINRLAFLQRLVIERQHREAEVLRAQSDQLLLNILPASVAERLKRGEPVADHFDEVSVLFADIVSFTPHSSRHTPAQVVMSLNQIFSAFDELTEKYGLEKIKTIGDAYMVVSGMPRPCAQHLEALVEMALEMQQVMRKFREQGAFDFDLRIGINSGPVVAGIIGIKKFAYDLWGDTVNVASRMESFGVAGAIQVPGTLYPKLKDGYVLRRRGRIEVKGKGRMMVYLLAGKREEAAPWAVRARATHSPSLAEAAGGWSPDMRS
jgi:class 3 adenylate cyclase